MAAIKKSFLWSKPSALFFLSFPLCFFFRDPAEYDGVSTYKTSIVFTLDEGSGQLFKALSVFALRDMSITKIESRPLRANPLLETQQGETTQFNYIFYLDYIGHTSELRCKQAMRHREFFFFDPAQEVLHSVCMCVFG